MTVKKNAASPSWREGWDLDMRRYIVRKQSTDDDEGGELWSVIDAEELRVMGFAKTQRGAVLIADSLEYLSHNATVSEFAAAAA